MINHNDYYDAGFHLFGLHGVKDDMCECGNPMCEALFKHPRVSNWQFTPLWGVDQFDVMEMTGQFSTGFGVLCDGYLIIDIDPRNGGNEGYKKLEKDTGINFKELSGFVVATGGGGWHIYFKYTGELKLSKNLKQYEGIDFKSNGFVVGCSSMHRSGNVYSNESGHPDDITDAPSVLVELLEKKPNTTFTLDKKQTTGSEAQEYLQFISPDEYNDWITIGMSLHNEFGDSGFNLWDKWSQQSDSYTSEEMNIKWHSFGKSSAVVTMGTLIQMARDGGYKEVVTFAVDDIPEDAEPLKLKKVSTKKAPGLVGECIDYINSCSRYPRERLAVSAALCVVSSVAGLNVEDEHYGAKPNIFCFNVSGSATGKESIQQSQRDLMNEAGIVNCIYGSIKSEQEIYRNITDHQLNSYIIDEFGILLSKVINSKAGSSSYLEGIIGALMSIYSKADGKLLIGGDSFKTILGDLKKEIAGLQKALDENTANSNTQNKLDALAKMQEELLTGGINEPFLTLSGFTTPVTFNSLVTYEQATNGFIGRSIFFEEKDNNPRAKRPFKKPKGIPLQLGHELRKLYGNGCASVDSEVRTASKGEKQIVTTTEEAIELLDIIQDDFHYRADYEMETTGLEAIPRRAFESVLKVSMVLAIGDGMKRTSDHVIWAYSLVCTDLDNKITLASANMAQEEKHGSLEVLNKVMHSLDKEHDITAYAIHRKNRSISQEEIQKALDYLVNKKEAVSVYIQPQRGKPATKYRLV